MRLQFNLEKKVQVQLAIEPPMSGEIHLNTIQPSSYPWSGTYFDGVPIELQPKPKTGFVFSHWLPASNIPDTLSDSLVVNVSQQTQTFTAVFKAAPLAPDGPDIHFSVQPNPSNGLFNTAIVKNDGTKWGSGIFALDANSKKEAVQLEQWLVSDTIQNAVKKILKLKNTHSFSGPMMKKLPWYE